MTSKTAVFAQDGFGTDAAWIDLLNSEHWDGLGALTDHLEDPHWVRLYLGHWNLAAPSSYTELKKPLLQLRGSLRRHLERWIELREIEGEFAHLLDTAIATPTRQRFSRAGGGYEVATEPVSKGWSWVRCKLVSPLALAICSPASVRIKRCPNPQCRWVFHDSTRANSRLWCHDARCGNRERVRRSRRASQSN